jgi:hypothetical protein
MDFPSCHLPTFLENLCNPALITCTFYYNVVHRTLEERFILSFQLSCHQELSPLKELKIEALCYKRNIDVHSRNHCFRGKAISISYSECVFVALVIQHAKRMRPIILSSVACVALPYFSTSSNKRHDFRGKSYWTQNVCFDFLCNFCLKYFFILRRIQRDIIINVH